MMNVRSEMIRFRNPTEHTLSLYAIGLENVSPGEEIDVPLEVCAPGRSDNGSRKPSILECVCPQLIPVNDADKKVLSEVPAPPEAISRVVSISKPQPSTEAPGVKALREKREAAIAAEKAKAAPVAPQAPAAPATK